MLRVVLKETEVISTPQLSYLEPLIIIDHEITEGIARRIKGAYGMDSSSVFVQFYPCYF